MKNLYILILAAFVITSCKEKETATQVQWVHTKTIALEGIHPIGIALGENALWLSDGDHKRVVQVDYEGKFLKSIDSLDRPMHIASENKALYIPQYGSDEILRVVSSAKSPVTLTDSLDAPAGVSVRGKELAIADFYNNRILYSSDSQSWLTFGKEGKADGDFYYPTDVQITEDAIWVADAYNNRIQKFDKSGNHLLTMGQDQNMNAATGVFVNENEVFSTDFENDRVLVFSKEGDLKQVLIQDISKPTDILIVNDMLYITNYKGKSLSVFEMKLVELTKTSEDSNSHGHEH